MARPLAVGVQLPEVEREVRWPELLDIAQAIEGNGFDSLWVGDHLLYRSPGEPPRGPWEAWSLLAGLAATTRRVLLGPLVAATAFHNPAMLAKKAATVDEISGGRLVVGLGAGWNEVEFDAFGLPFDHRASRFEEAFTIIRTLLREGQIDYAGRYYEARDCEIVPRPRPGGPKLMVGSIGPRVLQATLPHVDMWNGWHAWYGNGRAGLQRMLGELDTAFETAGRPTADVARTVAMLLGMSAGSGRRHGSPGRATSDPIVGAPAEIAGLLRDYAAAGIAHVQLVLDPITTESVDEAAAILHELDG